MKRITYVAPDNKIIVNGNIRYIKTDIDIDYSDIHAIQCYENGNIEIEYNSKSNDIINDEKLYNDLLNIWEKSGL